MKDSELSEGEVLALTTLGDPGLGSAGGDMGLTLLLHGDVTKDYELGNGEAPTESGGTSPDTSAEPALASPRLIPIPESRANSGSPACPPALEDSGQPPNSFDQQRAPPRLRKV